MKLPVRLIAEIGVDLIEHSEYPVFNRAFCTVSKTFVRMLTARRVQDFLERNNIVYRRLKGKKQVSEEKMEAIDRTVAAHLGSLKREFNDGTLDPNSQYNMDENHFMIDLDNGRTFDFFGAEHVKYRSIVSSTKLSIRLTRLCEL